MQKELLLMCLCVLGTSAAPFNEPTFSVYDYYDFKDIPKLAKKATPVQAESRADFVGPIRFIAPGRGGGAGGGGEGRPLGPRNRGQQKPAQFRAFPRPGPGRHRFRPNKHAPHSRNPVRPYRNEYYPASTEQVKQRPFFQTPYQQVEQPETLYDSPDPPFYPSPQEDTAAFHQEEPTHEYQSRDPPNLYEEDIVYGRPAYVPYEPQVYVPESQQYEPDRPRYESQSSSYQSPGPNYELEQQEYEPSTYRPEPHYEQQRPEYEPEPHQYEVAQSPYDEPQNLNYNSDYDPEYDIDVYDNEPEPPVKDFYPPQANDYNPPKVGLKDEESVKEKRQAIGGHLDDNGVQFAADAASVERGKGSGRLAFQIHGQQGPHSYRFGYDTGKGYNRHFRYEERGGDGLVRGRYGYYDNHGKLQVVNYSAHPEHGFKADVPHP